MPLNITIQADVIDISSDNPTVQDIFLVDTNVWFWTAYSRGSLTQIYPPGYDLFLKKALAAGSRLYTSGLIQSELMHAIERTEFELFRNQTAGQAQVKKKEFRHNYPAQRASVVAEMTTAWGIVENMATTVDLIVDRGMTKRVSSRVQTCAMDGYDLISVEAMFEHGLPQILTDDGDFGCVPDIQIFTANPNVLQAAKAQGKLLVR